MYLCSFPQPPSNNNNNNNRKQSKFTAHAGNSSWAVHSVLFFMLCLPKPTWVCLRDVKTSQIYLKWVFSVAPPSSSHTILMTNPSIKVFCKLCSEGTVCNNFSCAQKGKGLPWKPVLLLTSFWITAFTCALLRNKQGPFCSGCFLAD